MREDSDTTKDYSRVQHKGNRRVVLPPEGYGTSWGISCNPGAIAGDETYRLLADVRASN